MAKLLGVTFADGRKDLYTSERVCASGTVDAAKIQSADFSFCHTESRGQRLWFYRGAPVQVVMIDTEGDF